MNLFFRAFFMTLCGNELKTSINHPTVPDAKLYLFFDPTHNFKNMFNNWVSKRLFQLPDGHIGPTEITADYNHVQQLFELEESKPLKIAHRLTYASIHPSDIQKQSPRHALGKHLTYSLL